jgi:3-isopropylmalate/(R)-2-methylmalate dehydratase small subunit
MDKFSTLVATACPLALANIDTDQLIPARFMKRSRAQGYGGFLLHDLRFDDGGAPLDFVLDEPRFAGAGILVTRRNFGTGSSREAAVYALWDYGIRCVIAPSFGDIFASNAVKNGLLPALVSEAVAEQLLASLQGDATPQITVDLEALTITDHGTAIPFAIDSVRRQQLLNGWDDMDLTLLHGDAVAAFRAVRLKHEPWMLPQLPQS